MLPPVTLAVAETTPTVKTLPPVILLVALKLVPVAAPMFGVVRLALALTIMLPDPSNAVVLLSTKALNCDPTRLRPALLLAV